MGDGYKLGRKEYSRRYYLLHKDEIKKRSLNYQKMHHDRVLIYKKRGHMRNTLKESEYKRHTHQERKLDVLSHYSNPLECARCGIDDIDVLCLDHVNGGGASHRKSLVNRNLYRWIQINNYPPLFQVLCFNCNMKKRIQEDGRIKISN